MIRPFLSGMVTMAYLVAALFFARFWARRRDTLFVAFCAAFLLLAVNQALLSLANIPRADTSWLFLLRLAAFLCIAFAIARKNLGTVPDSK